MYALVGSKRESLFGGCILRSFDLAFVHSGYEILKIQR